MCEIAYYRKEVKMHMKNILDALSLHFELSSSPDPAKTKYQTMLKKKWYWTDDSMVENTAALPEVLFPAHLLPETPAPGGPRALFWSS